MNPAETQPAATRQKSIWPMFIGGLILIVLFYGVGLLLRSMTSRTIQDEEAIRAKERVAILAKVRMEASSQTTTYAWIDRAKGIVRVPVDRAVELAVTKLSAKGQPHAAYAMDPKMALESAVKPGGLAAPQPPIPPFSAPEPAAPAAPAPEAQPETPPATEAPSPQ